MRLVYSPLNGPNPDTLGQVGSYKVIFLKTVLSLRSKKKLSCNKGRMGRREGPSQALSTFCDQDSAGYFTHDFSSHLSSHMETRRLGEVTNLSRTQSEKTGRGGRHSSSLSPFLWQPENGAAGTTPEAGVRNRLQEDIICTISLFTIPLSLLVISTQPLTHLILFPQKPCVPSRTGRFSHPSLRDPVSYMPSSPVHYCHVYRPHPSTAVPSLILCPAAQHYYLSYCFLVSLVDSSSSACLSNIEEPRLPFWTPSYLLTLHPDPWESDASRRLSP